MAYSRKKSTGRKVIPYRKKPRVPRFNDVLRPMRVKMRYQDGVVLASTALIGFTTYAFRTNSLFDPDWTGTGHQPYRFDQLAAIYRKYTVVGSKITVEFTTGDKTVVATDTGPWQVGVAPSSSFTPSGTGSDMFTLSETADSSYGTLRNGLITTCRTSWNPKDFNLDVKDDSLGADVSANPSTTYAYVLWMWNQGSTAVTNVIANVTIEFDVEFTRPLQTTSS